MDIKEIGVGTVVVLGGAIYGVSEYGLGDVLQDELKAVAEVPMAEREAYMQSVAVQFTEFYDGAIYGTDTFNFAGEFKYDLDPRRAAFTEVAQSTHELTKAHIKELKAYHADKHLCETEDSLLFTDKGWTYTTKLKNINGRTMVIVSCKPKPKHGLRVG